MNMSSAFQQLEKPGTSWRDGSDFWKELCMMCRNDNVRTEIDLLRITEKIERMHKRNTGGSPMPGKYRSAKSVLARALRLNVPYLMHNGVPRGKSAVEKDCAPRQ